MQRTLTNAAFLLAAAGLAFATPAFAQKAAEQGASADYMNPKQFADFTSSESARWAQVVKTSNIEAD